MGSFSAVVFYDVVASGKRKSTVRRDAKVILFHFEAPDINALTMMKILRYYDDDKQRSALRTLMRCV